MATDKTDKITADLFAENEKVFIKEAIESHLATIRRRANNEKNPMIKEIYNSQLRDYATLVNKLQGL